MQGEISGEVEILPSGAASVRCVLQSITGCLDTLLLKIYRNKENWRFAVAVRTDSGSGSSAAVCGSKEGQACCWTAQQHMNLGTGRYYTARGEGGQCNAA